MKEQKKYFKSPYLKGNEDFLHKEFSDKLPTDHFLADQNNSDYGTSRRDFLKFLGFSTAAAVLSSCESPIQKSVPYLNQPEEIIPGVANFYASTYYQENTFASILVKTREGRPISISSNKDYEKTTYGGGLNSRGYASVLSLYDSNRLKSPLKNNKELSWDKLDAEVIKSLNQISKTKKKIVYLSPTVISPSHKKILELFQKKYKNVEIVYYDPISKSSIIEANKACFGESFVPTYNFDKAKVVVSFEADFLGDWLDTSHGRKYSFLRNPGTNMSKHYQFESLLTLTGSNSDKRVPVNPDEQLKYLMYIFAKLSMSDQGPDIENSNHKKLLDNICKELQENLGKSLVVSGSSDPQNQIIVNAINYLLDNYSKTIDYNNKSNLYSGVNSIFKRFLDDIEVNKIGALIINDLNIIYNFPKLKEKLNNVKLKIQITDSKNETSNYMDFTCPKSHFLESWGDASPYTGIYTIQQPTINPLFNSRESEQILLKWIGVNDSYYNYLKSFYKSMALNKSWNKILHDGYCEIDFKAKDYVFSSKVAQEITKNYLPDNSVENNEFLMFYSKTSMGDGYQSNNPWLQELPDPVTKVTWDNYLTINPVHAKNLGLKNWHVSDGALNGDVVLVKLGEKSLKVPVYIQPGQKQNVLGLAFGYGRNESGKVGNGIGVNAFDIYDNFNLVQKNNFSITKVEGVEHEFACTQNSHTMMGRSIVKETTLNEYLKNPKSGNEDFKLESYKGKVSASELNLYQEWEPSVHFWNMSIDLSKCHGCGACVIACHAENNVPVVGKQEVRKNRDMHWLRIDRYYSSDMTKDLAEEKGIGAIEMYKMMEEPSSEESLEVVFQPVMCQHCNQAPCENVCPVAATTHSNEGLNQMTYNRCIGTRYCMNNCPYKVRRFNWFNYKDNDNFDFNMNDDLGKMVLNPDVTVRARGVMEKCSMCIQNIQKTKLDAKRERRKIRDGEVSCACETACDTGAIVFGDALDSNSRISKEKNHPRTYALLEELNTQPSVFYKTKVRNKNKVNKNV
ncbi:MAG: hypothetical protein CMP68_02490 [Flavobacteriales bacterium]|nr:hypothetical protein [Flavobacteriales bacterium]|tara:strand:- start:11898 stop:14954 length:3057 start_codon:yes stop_codon:yes gene_type:complete